MRVGTSHFPSPALAARYYRDYGLTPADVTAKIDAGEIHIGKPPVKAGERVVLIDAGRRYAIERGGAGPLKESGAGKRASSPEQGLHLFVADCLRLQAAPGVIWFHPPNQGPRSKRYAAKLKRMGVLAGVADFVVVAPGGAACFLELKSATGRLSPEQRAFREAAGRASAAYTVATTPEEAVNALLQWGALACDPLRRIVSIAA